MEDVRNADVRQGQDLAGEAEGAIRDKLTIRLDLKFVFYSTETPHIHQVLALA